MKGGDIMLTAEVFGFAVGSAVCRDRTLEEGSGLVGDTMTC